MAKVYSPTLERRVLKAMCGNGKIGSPSSYLGAKVRVEHFVSEAALTAYERVRQLQQSTNETPSWDSILEDPSIHEDIRAELSDNANKPIKTMKVAKSLFDNLESFRRKRAVGTTIKTAGQAFTEGADVDALADMLRAGLANIELSTADIRTTYIGVGDIDAKVKTESGLYTLKQAFKADKARVVATGFAGFDKHNRGFLRKAMVLMAATTGGGKSAVALTVAKNAASMGAKVGIISLEMPKEQLIIRLTCAEAEVPITDFLEPQRMSEEHKTRALKAYKALTKQIDKAGGQLQIHDEIDNVDSIGLFQFLESRTYDMFIIDYVALLSDSDGDDQAKALSRITRRAKQYAAKKDCVAVCLSQLSDDGKVRYSRAQVEHADNAWLWVQGEADEEGNRILHITQPKSRNQSPQPFDLLFQGKFMKVTDADPEKYGDILKAIKNGSSSSGGFGKDIKPADVKAVPRSFKSGDAKGKNSKGKKNKDGKKDRDREDKANQASWK
jgi:replicative DNA helicase